MSYQESFNELNEEQKEAVLSRSHNLIIAGPGSGKTKMLSTKAAMLLDEGEIVAALTFSKAGAIELKERIEKLCKPGQMKNIRVGTFHGISQKLLGGKQEIAMDGTRLLYVRSAIEELELDLKDKDAMMIIDSIKSKGVNPDRSSVEGKLYFHYQKQLQLNRQIDFGDLIVNAVLGMESGNVQPLPVTHLLIDEIQDTDAMQYRWIFAHLDKRDVTVTGVGDDDQSIYGFRSAMGYSGMQSFLLKTNAQQIILNKNYRCRKEVLAPALKMIGFNKDRIHKQLVAAKGSGGRLETKLFKTSEDEAQFIMESIGDYKRCSHAVLSRNNSDLDLIESFLRSAGIAYYRPADKSLFSYAEVTMYFNLIELIAGLKKDVGIEQIFRFIDIDERDRTLLHEMKIPNFRKMNKADLVATGISDEGATLYRNFATHYEEWRNLYERSTASCTFSLLINGVVEWLIEKIPEKKETTRRVLYSASIALDRLQGTIADRLKYLRDEKNNEPDEHAVMLMTLHGSKGLEFSEVYIIRSEATICPSEKSPLDEERRLFYVGMTRAKEKLYVTMTAKNPTSMFVAEYTN